jgi:hypothetical protein
MENCQFKDFHPEFDYYSLGILLIEIGYWNTIDRIMHDHTGKDNTAFKQELIEGPLAELYFSPGSKYATAIRCCLTGLGESKLENSQGIPPDARTTILFKDTVITPLRSLSAIFQAPEECQQGEKRTLDTESDDTTISIPKRLKVK